MKAIWDTVRFTLISLEAVVALALIAVYQYSPLFFNSIGALILKNDQMTYTLLGFPLVSLSLGFNFAVDLVKPKDMSDDQRKKFYKWEGYPLLRNRVHFFWALCFVAFFSNIVLWLACTQQGKGTIGFYYALINATCLTTTLSIAIANLTLKPILDGYRK